MSKPLVRLFVEPGVCLFRLSPLYAEPGWYGAVDGTGAIGPYRFAEQVADRADELLARREQTRRRSLTDDS